MKKRRIGVLTGGGDCAGLNPALKWVVKSALDEYLAKIRGFQYEVLGIRDGFKGLAVENPDDLKDKKYVEVLNEELVRTWDRYGGTMLGTSRYSPYDPKDERSKLVIENIERLGLDVLIVLGGDGTLSIASRLSQAGVNVVGIPKTIDKDLVGTDYTLGFDTALNVVTEEVDRLRTTAGSHKRIFVIETMGRTAGWLALEGGEACGAFVTLIPEYDFSIDKINEIILDGKRKGSRYEIILAAEGAKFKGGSEVVKREGADSFGRKALGGIAEIVADEINKGTAIETRSIVLSHLQRGGSPSAHDRRMGRNFGIAAVDLANRNSYGKMVCLLNGHIAVCDLKDIIGKVHLVDVPKYYDTLRYCGRRTIL